VLHTILTDELGAEAVRMPARCVGVRQDGAGATAVLADGTERRADVVIGADGVRSAVRISLRHGYDLPPRYANYTAWQAITELPGEDVVPSGTFFNLWGRGGLRFLYCRLNEREVYWDAITSDRVASRFDMLRVDKRGALAAAYRHWPRPVGQIIASTSEEALLPVAIYDRPPPAGRTWGRGRVALVGDAAHPQTLNLSQGAGQAIEDGVLLARLLTEREDPAAAIDEFEGLRRDRVYGMVRMAWRIGLLGHVRSGPLCALRDVFMRVFFNTVAERGTYKLMMDVDR
jgi:2-polyprenyl-6-methoxyphenol hydroxylase-like FAD-dependent oxidoreductase